MSLQGLAGSLGASGATEQGKDPIGTMNRPEWMIPGKCVRGWLSRRGCALGEETPGCL